MKKSFTINRKKWRHGSWRREAESLLLDEKGKRCPVGFFLSALGVPDSALLNCSCASEVAVKLPRQARWLVSGDPADDTRDGMVIYTVNDDAGVELEEREQVIRRVFKDHKINVRFAE